MRNSLSKKSGCHVGLKFFARFHKLKKKLKKFFIFQNGFRLVCGWRNCKSFIVALWYERGWKNKRRFTFIFEFLQLFRLLIKIHWATLLNLSKKMFVFHIFIFWFSKEKKKKFRRNISKTWKQKFGRTRISHLFFFRIHIKIGLGNFYI